MTLTPPVFHPPHTAWGKVRGAVAHRVVDLMMRGIDAQIQILKPREFYARAASRPSLAVGEGYVMGEWEPAAGVDLAECMEPFARRIAVGLAEPWRTLRSVADRKIPAALRNTLRGSRRNIEAHYDLSNEMFAAFLDESMSYSSALFDPTRPMDQQDLHEAQLRKIDAALDAAGVGAGMNVLEIGTGWGSLAIRAAQRGARVRTVTLSTEQAQLARERVAARGLEDLVEVEIRDYREVRGSFEAIVSIEMIEAVGADHWRTYFEMLDRSLDPNGAAVLQAITLPHERHLAAKHSSGWLQRYIFPGGELPSLDAIDRIATAHTQLRVESVLAFGTSYAETLRRWRASFLAAWPTIAGLGFDEVFRRTWEFYLAYCQAGFAAGAIDVDQVVLRRPIRGPIRAG